MATVGSMYLGGNEFPTDSPAYFQSGIAFGLRDAPASNHVWNSDDSKWQIELKKDHAYVVARSHEAIGYDGLVTSGLDQVQRCLDIVAVKRIATCNVHSPDSENIAIFPRDGKHVFRHFCVHSLGIAVSATAEVIRNGKIVPQPPPPEPTWIQAFRYYRLSQSSQDIFEAYRNLFLSLEALLNDVCPKLTSEGEKQWLSRALSSIATKVDLSRHIPPSGGKPIDYLIQTQYTNVRCRLFHAKYPNALLPHADLNPTDVLVAYDGLLRLWRDIAESHYSVPGGGGAFTYQGFKLLMDGVFSEPLSVHFTEDDSPAQEGDTSCSPRGMATMSFASASYLGQTQPGLVSWQAELTSVGSYANTVVHRICTKLGDSVMFIASIAEGMTPAGVDVFETLQSCRLVNKSQPKTSF